MVSIVTTNGFHYNHRSLEDGLPGSTKDLPQTLTAASKDLRQRIKLCCAQILDHRCFEITHMCCFTLCWKTNACPGSPGRGCRHKNPGPSSLGRISCTPEHSRGVWVGLDSKFSLNPLFLPSPILSPSSQQYSPNKSQTQIPIFQPLLLGNRLQNTTE